MRQTPRVTIAMGVLNGAAYLPAQLRSIADQRGVDWRLLVSHDRSTDESLAIVSEFSALHPGQVTQIEGPGRGFAANYLHLLGRLGPNAGFVAFADQDDIWLPDKLIRAMGMLRGHDDRPALYCARRWVWIPETGGLTATPSPRHPPGFRNALIENIACGNTAVLNRAAVEHARLAAPYAQDIFAHDWWLYLLITGAGGKVIFDRSAPRVMYRQHDRNTLGANARTVRGLHRRLKTLGGLFSRRVSGNLAALDRGRHLLTPEAQHLLSQFTAARHAPLYARFATMRRLAPYRQTPIGMLGFWGALALGKV